jgi:predicted nucleic acid-binding protein
MPTATDAEPPDDVVLVDTSVAIALATGDHELHRAAIAAVGGRRLGLAGHAWFETYSVLTRLPAPRRRSPRDALRILAHNFAATAFLSATESMNLANEIAQLGISGGSVYDGLVGAAARAHGRTLLTADARAQAVYEALGVEIELVAAVQPPADENPR